MLKSERILLKPSVGCAFAALKRQAAHTKAQQILVVTARKSVFILLVFID
jgi:hypothetical protein